MGTERKRLKQYMTHLEGLLKRHPDSRPIGYNAIDHFFPPAAEDPRKSRGLYRYIWLSPSQHKPHARHSIQAAVSFFVMTANT
jgi:hypothetical protein